MNLYDEVTHWLRLQANKHELGKDYTKETLNAMTNEEFLRAISDGLEEMNSKDTE